MVYNTLLLSAGGGIFSPSQQSNQVQNTANVFIGLGGTGVDCLAKLKKEIHKRLKPDDPTASIPDYRHIQFLGVDSDIYSERKIDSTDFFNIYMNGINGMLDKQHHLNWFRADTITGADFALYGCGGISQVGRMMFMKKSEEFINRLKRKIRAAKEGLEYPLLNIHIITGTGGATGSGSFLDVCYLVRSLENDPDIGNFTSFAYVFMPDVNLSRQMDSLTANVIKRNGYAALQEIDYCMNLERNGGKFYQEYAGGRQVAWDRAPVDMCHLISATNTSSDTIKDAYKYAQSAVTEYIMDFLIQPADQDAFGIMSQLSTFTARVCFAENAVRRGVNLRYCTIGAAGATMPLAEINTYLAAHSFKKFVNNTKDIRPSEDDVRQLAIEALAPTANSVADIYYKLFEDITSEAASTEFAAYEGSFRDLLPDNIAPFVDWYSSQEDKKIGALTSKIESLSNGNENSLIERIKKALKRFVCGDGEQISPKGPSFAYQMLFEGAEFNLINIITGLIKYNEQRFVRVRKDLEELQKYYKNSEDDFLNRRKRRLFDNDNKRFNDYETDMINCATARYQIEVYKKIGTLLENLQRQIREENLKFYTIFKRVMENLSYTFELNLDYLKAMDHLDNADSFYVPLMTIAELKPTMDYALMTTDFSKMFGSFLNMFFDNTDKWIDENESKISKLVTDFFIGTAFTDFAGKNISDFLADKYGTNNTAILSQYIYDDYITRLVSRSELLFPFDTGLINPASLSRLEHIFVPYLSPEIQNAAENYAQIDINCIVNVSDLTDRIYMINTAYAFPIGSYALATDYEAIYFNYAHNFGVHCYEGERNGSEGRLLNNMIFKDWRKLPPLRPQSYIDIDNLDSDEMKALIQKARSLYHEGKRQGLIDENNKILIFDSQAVSNLEQQIARAEYLLETFEENNNAELSNLLTAIESIKDIRQFTSNYAIYSTGSLDEDIQQRISEDYFTYSPVLNIIVEESLNQQEKITSLIEKFQLIKQEFSIKTNNL